MCGALGMGMLAYYWGKDESGDFFEALAYGSATAFLCSQKFLIGSVVRSTGTIGKKGRFFSGEWFRKTIQETAYSDPFSRLIKKFQSSLEQEEEST